MFVWFLILIELISLYADCICAASWIKKFLLSAESLQNGRSKSDKEKVNKVEIYYCPFWFLCYSQLIATLDINKIL